jgi:hypothetical protein
MTTVITVNEIFVTGHDDDMTGDDHGHQRS